MRITRLELASWLTAPLLPAAGLLTAAHPRWRADWRERWGVQLPPVQPGAVWVVASSLGEIRAGAALVRALGGGLLTADTDTGAALARDLVPVSGRKPVDHPWTLAPLWAEARPRAVVWVEGAWWPGLAAMARQAGVPSVRVNARGSRSAALRLQLGLEADRVVARDRAAVRWFAARGVAAELGGELKLANLGGPNPLQWSGAFGVAGSVHRSDLPAVSALIRASPAGMQWLVAPRQLRDVGWWLEHLGPAAVLRSTLDGGQVPAGPGVVVLDSIGELGRCFGGAVVAWVGGTLDPAVGGHSPAEAWTAGVPTLAGPQRWAQGEVFDLAGTRSVAVVDEVGGALDEALAAGPVAVGSVHGKGAERAARVVEQLLGDLATESAPRPWARPAAAVHRAGRRAWHRVFDHALRPTVRLGVPVVSVGSANARSPGKTTTVRWILGELKRRGFSPGVASRGYRRGRTGVVGSWEAHSAWDLGDEAAVLAREGWPVAAGVDRVAGARLLVERGVDAVVLDDGLQHRALHRDLDLVVVDARFPGARGELPMGEGREDAVPARAHGVVLHHGAELPAPAHCPVARATRRMGSWHLGSEPRPAGPSGPVAAFAGLGRPADFLSSLDLAVDRFRGLADHQPIDAALATELVAWAGELPLVCPDKDHVRLDPALAQRVWWRSVSLELSPVPQEWFDRLNLA